MVNGSTFWGNTMELVEIRAYEILDGRASEIVVDLNTYFSSEQGFGSPEVVPEPSTFAIWSLIGLTFAGIGWRRRRKVSDVRRPIDAVVR